jgi:hypothetical protein
MSIPIANYSNFSILLYRGLRSMRLYCNNIGNDGAAALAAALWSNERLQSLVCWKERIHRCSPQLVVNVLSFGWY